jgi:hypothetical protein
MPGKSGDLLSRDTMRFTSKPGGRDWGVQPPPEDLLMGLRSSDVTALSDAWRRLEEAQAGRDAALVDLIHLCSELGVLSKRHLTVVPESR